MSGIRFITGEKGRTVGILIDLKKHGAIFADFWDGLVSESRRLASESRRRFNRAKRKRAFLTSSTAPAA